MKGQAMTRLLRSKRAFAASSRLGVALVLGSGLVFAAACGGGSEVSPPPGNQPGGETPGSGSDSPPGVDAPPGTPQPSGQQPPGTTPPSPNDTGTPTPSNPAPQQPAVPTAGSCQQSEVGEPVLRLLTRLEFENTVNAVFPGIAGQWTQSLPANSVSASGFDNSANAMVGAQTGQLLLRTAESIADAVTGSAFATLLPCSAQAADRACAASFIEQYGRRLFRRSLSNDEQERYLTFFDTALAQADFTTAMKWVTVGLVQSPNTVYRSEIGAPNGDGARQLTPYEVATLLAYTFGGTTPSDELLDAAEAGTLGDLAERARQLLETESGKQTLHRFFEGYTGYTTTASKQKPNAISNGIQFNDVSTDMVRETRAFIEHVVYDQQGTLQDLLTHDTTYPSQRLASYYGISAPSADFTPVERPEGQGIGLLAQAAFLASHSNSDASSPTQRGLFAYTRLLCRAQPPLPDDVPQLGDPEPGVRTTRQRYEDLHAREGACASCHALFDPIGFAFEHFDEAGRYRENENSLEIDPSGYLSTRSGEQRFFEGQESLVQTLAQEPEVHECFAAYLSTYAFGTAQSCLGAGAAAGLREGGYGILEAYAALASEPHFTQRRAP